MFAGRLDDSRNVLVVPCLPFAGKVAAYVGGSLDVHITISNEAMGGDPLHGTPKRLRVVYTVEGRSPPYVVEGVEGSALRIYAGLGSIKTEGKTLPVLRAPKLSTGHRVKIAEDGGLVKMVLRGNKACRSFPGTLAEFDTEKWHTYSSQPSGSYVHVPEVSALLHLYDHRHQPPHENSLCLKMPVRRHTPAESVEALVQGNRRFMQDRSHGGDRSLINRLDLGAGQSPYAVVVACADSRCSPEVCRARASVVGRPSSTSLPSCPLPVKVLFDAGLGDLFVVRCAGHIVDSALLGSIEYAVEHLGSNAIVVVGHEKCGAVKAAVAEFNKAFAPPSSSHGHGGGHHGDLQSGFLGTFIAPLLQAVSECTDAFVATGTPRAHIPEAELVEASVRLNVALTAKSLTDRSPMLKQRVGDGRIVIAGFRYDIDSPPDETGDGTFLQSMCLPV